MLISEGAIFVKYQSMKLTIPPLELHQIFENSYVVGLLELLATAKSRT
jgi:hypothetical protein